MLDAEPSRYALGAMALFSIVIVRLPVWLGHPHVLHPIIIALFLLCIGWALPRNHQGPAAAQVATFSFLYAAVVAISLVRGARAGVYSSTLSAVQEGVLYLVLVGFGLTLIASSRDQAERSRRLVLLALAPAVYAIANLALYFGGVRSPAANDPTLTSATVGSPATLLGDVGIHVGRVIFPFGSSINLFGVICAAGLSSAVILMLRVPAAPRWLTTIGAVACAVCLLLSDSRAAIVVAAGIILYFLLNKRGAGSHGFALIIPALPLLVVGLLSALDSAGLSSVLSRNGAGTDFSTATGRTEIWRAAWNIFRHPDLQQLIGWGANGHITSGASLQWAYLFRGVLKDPTTAPTHNIAIQTLFDSGYLGLAVLVWAAALTCFQLVRHVAREPKSPAIALLGTLLVLLACGATEISPSYYAQEALVTVLLIMGASAGLGAIPPRSSGTAPELADGN